MVKDATKTEVAKSPEELEKEVDFFIDRLIELMMAQVEEKALKKAEEGIDSVDPEKLD